MKQGTHTASRVSQTTGILRPEVYRVLRELTSKGFVVQGLDTPSTYTAVAPGQALSLFLKQSKKKLAVLEQKKVQLAKSLEGFSCNQEESCEGHFYLITGADNLFSKFLELIANAQADYASITSREGFEYYMDSGMADAIISAVRRKVRVRMISEIDDSNIQTTKHISKYVEVRHCKGIGSYFDIIDGKEVILGSALGRRNVGDQTKSGVYSKDPSFTNGIYSLFEYIWKDLSKWYDPEPAMARSAKAFSKSE